MDRPNEKDADPQHMTRTEYARSVRAAVEERRHRVTMNRQQFEPQIKEQINRLFSEYQAPLYVRLLTRSTREQTLSLAANTTVEMAAHKNKRLNDTETQALTEHFLSTIHSMYAWKWALTGMAAYMAYRGRKTMRFPFLKPKITGSWMDPERGGQGMRLLWHTARFGAYYGVCFLFGNPLFQSVNYFRQNRSLRMDPRLTSLFDTTGGGNSTGEVFGAAQDDGSGQQYDEPWRSQPVTEQSWSSSESGRRSRPEQPQSSSQGWGSGDNLEDVTPVTSSSPSSTPSLSSDLNRGGAASGSAWDRVRQQARHSPSQPHAQDQRSWEAPRGTGGWGSDDDASPQYRGPRDSYSFSPTDEEKATAKSQAQKDFDEMLERERQGAGPERGSWGGK